MKGKDGLLVTVLAAGGIEEAGLSILASRWTSAMRSLGIRCELILERADRHPDEGLASEFASMREAVVGWCNDSTDGDRLLVVGLPGDRDDAVATVAALSEAGAAATLLWETPGVPILSLGRHLGVAPPSELTLGTLNRRYLGPLRSQFPRSRVVHLPLALPTLPPPPQRADDLGPFAVSIGRFTSRKGAGTLSARWATDTGPALEVPLLMLGSGYRAIDSEEQSVREIAVSSPWVKCEMIGPLEERLDRLRRAVCAVFAAVDDHLPQALAEAMSVGAPVVVTPIPGHLDVIEDGSTGFVLADTDLTDLRDVVGKILTDPEGAQSVGLAGRRRAESLFGPSVAGRKIMAGLGRT